MGKKEKRRKGKEEMRQTNDKRIESFEDLLVWQKGIALVKHVYLVTETGLLRKDFGLRDQLRRAAVSIPTNIAEGFERSFHKEYLRFLNIAKGSAGEVRSLLTQVPHCEDQSRLRERKAMSFSPLCFFVSDTSF